MIFLGLVIYVAIANSCPAGTRSNIPKQNNPAGLPHRQEYSNKVEKQYPAHPS